MSLTRVMEVNIEPSWKKVLAGEFEQDYFKELTDFVRDEYKSKTIYPPPKLVFNAFELCPFDDVRTVILGQDPYHGKSQAHGLSFSVQDGITIPPSLKNIYKEINNDLGLATPSDGNLERWAKQGVLLLNASLTVEANTPASHTGRGWEQFTNNIIQKISDEKENVVFLLWGKFAQSKSEIIDESKHFILTAPHPSPFSAHSGFFGCKHFSKTNEYLKSVGGKPIDWS